MMDQRLRADHRWRDNSCSPLAANRAGRRSYQRAHCRHRGGVTLTELARRLNVAEPTLYPMLETRTECGFVVRRAGRKTYHWGPALVAAGAAAAARNGALDAARRAMLDLGARRHNPAAGSRGWGSPAARSGVANPRTRALRARRGAIRFCCSPRRSFCCLGWQSRCGPVVSRPRTRSTPHTAAEIIRRRGC